jgi:hypothetical protein
MRIKTIARVPWQVLAVLLAALAAQLTFASLRQAPRVSVSALPSPPSAAVLRVVSLDQPALAARLMMLWLQAYDYQPGVSLPFRGLDYAAIEAWLARMLELDPTFQYPLLAAARLYGEVDDAPRQRRMLAFIASSFSADPARRWPWLAHGVYLAKHRLKDPALALQLAEALAAADPAAAIPDWARQMRIFVLEDMGELESAKVLLGGLLASGKIVDSHERYFLGERLAELERRGAGQAAPPAR